MPDDCTKKIETSSTSKEKPIKVFITTSIIVPEPFSYIFSLILHPFVTYGNKYMNTLNVTWNNEQLRNTRLQALVLGEIETHNSTKE